MRRVARTAAAARWPSRTRASTIATTTSALPTWQPLSSSASPALGAPGDATAIQVKAASLADVQRAVAACPPLRQDRQQYDFVVTSRAVGTRLSGEQVEALIESHNGAGHPAHLYFHVPLCHYICKFCNFSRGKLSGDRDTANDALDLWTRLLMLESAEYARRNAWAGEACIGTVYLGGGTAAALREQHLERLLGHVHDTYTVADGCEVTLEGNPDNFLDSGYLASAMGSGVTRFSMGVQSFDKTVTEFSGRGHTEHDSVAAIDRLHSTGRPFNVDLIHGLPLQTAQSFVRDVEQVAQLGVPSVTLYRLRNHNRRRNNIGTVAAWESPRAIERMERQGVWPSWDETYTMRTDGAQVLAAYGYTPGPCGQWNLPGTYGCDTVEKGGASSGWGADGVGARAVNMPRVYEGRWAQYQSLIAFGPSAYGWLVTPPGTAATTESAAAATPRPTVLQTHNHIDARAYMSALEVGHPMTHGVVLDDRAAAAVAFGFTLKAMHAVDVDAFAARYGVDVTSDEPFASVIAEMLALGLLEDRGGALAPTMLAEALHEEVVTEFCHRRMGTNAEGPLAV